MTTEHDLIVKAIDLAQEGLDGYNDECRAALEAILDLFVSGASVGDPMPYRCLECSREFLTADVLNTHIDTEHSEGYGS